MIGSFPPGLRTPVSASAIAAPPCSPGNHAITTAAAASWTAGEPIGRPATSTSTTGVPVAATASDEFLLHPRQVE